MPRLTRRLAKWSAAPVDAGDEFSLSPPHERALAAALGWQGDDGTLPWAARLAAKHGLAVSDHAWGLLTPVHLLMGTEQVTLIDPATLALDADCSRSLLEAVRTLFESEGFGLHWVAADQWLATHPLFDGLPTASLDRVTARNIDAWLPDAPRAKLLRRLQNEVQMLLYTHPLNDQREASGLRPINSFWLSGCGRAQAERAGDVRVDDRLRGPALAEDWVAWREAWIALDASLGDEARSITLCGERSAQRFEPRAKSLWRRVAGAFQSADIHRVLEAL
ncbi:MAG: hypothetical protein HY021_06210 [Burkholderiales bacterium]|nr:hypothetical protein [Burkholderiales bacterium]